MSELRIEFLKKEIEPIYIGGTSACISENGEILATPLDEDVVVTNVLRNEVLYKIEGDGEAITSLVMTPDGSTLGIVSQSQQLRILNLKTGEIKKVFKLSSPVFMSAADQTSTLFGFGGSDGTITVWDVENGYVTHSLKGHGSTICSLTFYGELNSSNWKLASGEILGTVKIWDLVKRKCTNTITEHNTAARGIAFSHTGEHFITGGRDELAIIYNTKNYKPFKTFSLKMQIENAGFINLPDSEYSNESLFYTAGSGNVLKIWDFEGNLVAHTTEPLRTTEELMIIDVKFLADNKLLLILSDQTLAFCDVTKGVDRKDAIELPIERRIAGNHGTIADIKFVGPDFSLLALATNSPSLRIVDPKNPIDFLLCEGHTDLLNAVDVSIDGIWILTGSKDSEANLWKWNGSTFIKYASFRGHAGAVTAVALPKVRFLGHPPFVITGSSDLTVKKWKVPTLETPETVRTSVYTRRAHEKDINAIDVSPNDAYFATASYDKTGKVWDLETGETLSILRGHKRGLWDINFCKYDKMLVTASGDKTIKIWSLNDFTCIKTFQGHTNTVQRARFFNINQQVVTSGADGLVKIWDVKDFGGDCLRTLDNHDNRIWALDVKNDGAEIISADADGYMTIWVDNTEAFLKEQEQQKQDRIERDQQLSNYINEGDWSNAFLLALTLQHSMRMYNVIKSAIGSNVDPESEIGSFGLEKCISLLTDEQLAILLKKARDWNINSKNFEISQRLFSVILKCFSPERLMGIQGISKVVEAIIPYNERHYQRIDDLLQETYILDYAVELMDRLT